MPDLVCNTSPMQYLYQVGHLELLPTLYQRVMVPRSVVAELAEGRARGIALPDPEHLDWVRVVAAPEEAMLRIVADLGPGEREAIAIALAQASPLLVLDDGPARRYAKYMGIPVVGTLGVLLKAKSRNRIEAVRPIVDELEALRFRLAPKTRAAVLKLAGE